MATAAERRDDGPRWWVDAMTRVGVPTVLLLAIIYMAGRFLVDVAPECKQFLASAARQLDVVSESVPKMQSSLEQLVRSLPLLQHSMDRIERQMLDMQEMQRREAERKGG